MLDFKCLFGLSEYDTFPCDLVEGFLWLNLFLPKTPLFCPALRFYLVFVYLVLF